MLLRTPPNMPKDARNRRRRLYAAVLNALAAVVVVGGGYQALSARPLVGADGSVDPFLIFLVAMGLAALGFYLLGRLDERQWRREQAARVQRLSGAKHLSSTPTDD